MISSTTSINVNKRKNIPQACKHHDFRILTVKNYISNPKTDSTILIKPKPEIHSLHKQQKLTFSHTFANISKTNCERQEHVK